MRQYVCSNHNASMIDEKPVLSLAALYKQICFPPLILGTTATNSSPSQSIPHPQLGALWPFCAKRCRQKVRTSASSPASVPGMMLRCYSAVNPRGAFASAACSATCRSRDCTTGYTGRCFLVCIAALKEPPHKAVTAEVDCVAAAVNLSLEQDKRLSAYGWN